MTLDLPTLLDALWHDLDAVQAELEQIQSFVSARRALYHLADAKRRLDPGRADAESAPEWMRSVEEGEA